MINVQLSVNIDNEVLEKLSKDGIKDLKKEELAGIVKDSFKKALEDNPNLLLGLLTSDRYFYGRGVGNKEPSELLMQAIRTMPYDEYFGDLTTIVAEHIKQNYAMIIQNAVMSLFSEKLFSSEGLMVLQSEFMAHSFNNKAHELL